jgi:hypothetical protein
MRSTVFAVKIFAHDSVEDADVIPEFFIRIPGFMTFKVGMPGF